MTKLVKVSYLIRESKGLHYLNVYLPKSISNAIGPGKYSMEYEVDLNGEIAVIFCEDISGYVLTTPPNGLNRLACPFPGIPPFKPFNAVDTMVRKASKGYLELTIPALRPDYKPYKRKGNCAPVDLAGPHSEMSLRDAVKIINQELQENETLELQYDGDARKLSAILVIE